MICPKTTLHNFGNLTETIKPHSDVTSINLVYYTVITTYLLYIIVIWYTIILPCGTYNSPNALLTAAILS